MLYLNYTMFGAVVLACFTISLFFLKFWKTTKDAFFLFFAISFFLDGISRIVLTILANHNEYDPFVYSIRLLSFAMILFAIIRKNEQRRSKQD